MESIGARLRTEREAQGISRKEMERRTGVGYSTIAELERGGMQTSTKLRAFADALGVTVKWLETGKGPKHPVTAGELLDGWSPIEASTQGVSAGGGRVPDNYAETHRLLFRRESLERKGLRTPHLRVEYVRGDSMLPRLRDGDAVLVDTSDRAIKDGRIYLIQYEGEHYLKVLHQAGKAVVIESTNKQDPQWRRPVVVNDGDDFEVLGRMRWLGSWED